MPRTGLYVDFDLMAPLTKEAERVLSRWARIEGTRLGFYESESVPWKIVFARLEKEGASVSPKPPISATEDFDWKRNADQCAAGVLVPGDGSGAANPPEDYDPVLPEPHLGFLPPGKPLRVNEKPRGHLFSVGADLIMSEKLARVLGRSKKHGDQNVVLKGEVLSGWTRLLPDQACRVVSDDSFCPDVSCAICGARLRPSLGVWLAVEKPDLHQEMAADVNGHDHLGREYPVVVSVELASFLAREFRAGLAVDPVYAWQSKKAELLREILGGVRRLMRESPL